MTRIQRNTGKELDDLKPPPLPNNLAYLWVLYLDIRKGAALVGYNEINAFQKTTGHVLSPWEVSLMLDIDLLRNNND